MSCSGIGMNRLLRYLQIYDKKDYVVNRNTNTLNMKKDTKLKHIFNKFKPNNSI